MLRKTVLAFAILFAALSSAAYAGSTSIGARVSTLGVGAELENTVTESIGVRAGVNYLPIDDYSVTEGGIRYSFDIDLKSIPVVIDWHPFKNSFRVSGGAIYNGNEITATATPSASITIGGTTYTAPNVGTIKAEIDYDKVAPYASFGWDTSFGKSGKFGLVVEIGAFYQSEPDISYSTTGLLASDAGFLVDLEREKKELEDALDQSFYPVVALGFSYRF